MGIIRTAKELYGLEGYELTPAPGHDDGRNSVYICAMNGDKRFVMRVSQLGDRTEEEYLAEVEFIRYLAANGAPVADVLPSARGKLVEHVGQGETATYIALFTYAKGMLISDNGYRYRKGAPLEEYFYNTGKTLGTIHRLSKRFTQAHRRQDYFDKYNMEYIGRLIPDDYDELKQAVSRRLDEFRALPKDKDSYGLVHFDFSDGNYHIDMETGAITVFDFDNCMNCWYMFDLANLWIHGEGWSRGENDPEKRMAYMRHYFDTVLQGYRTETDISEKMLEKLPLVIDMVLIENIVDEFEICAREGEELDYEDIEDAAECLIMDIPYANIGN